MNKDLIIEYLQLKAEASAYKNDPDNIKMKNASEALEYTYYTLCEIAGFKESCWSNEKLQEEIIKLKETLKEFKGE